MAPRVSEESWQSSRTTSTGLVTDEETTDEETDGRQELRIKQIQQPPQDRWIKRIKARDKPVVRIGDHCLILVGKTGRDIGQQGIVTELMPVMMGVEYRDGQNHKMVLKTKRPSSLLMLEEGLEIVRDKKGTLWVRQSETTTGEHERNT